MATEWYQLDRATVLGRLRTTARGLTDREVVRRRARFGTNTLPRDRERSWWMVAVRQLRGPFVAVLLIAAFISFALGDATDAYVILAAVLINVLVGWFQERKAERTLYELRRVVAFTALVIRDGAERVLSPEELVPGDIVLLKPGFRVPADLRLLRSQGLSVDEAALTGEFAAVAKTVSALRGDRAVADCKNMAFFGTHVVLGEGTGAVVATGNNTAFGRIAQSVAAMDEAPTPLQQRLRRLSTRLSTIVLGIAFCVFLLGIAVQRPVAEMFAVAVAVAVAAIPEGLLVSVTVILALGMRRMLGKKALVRHLAAAETLGSTTVICSDKTGTLTEGKMTVVRVVTALEERKIDRGLPQAAENLQSASSVVHALTLGMLCNDAVIEQEGAALAEHRVVGNPTDQALVAAAHASGMTRAALEKQFPRVAALPFSSDRRFMATQHRVRDGLHRVILKGAPETVIGRCTAYDENGQRKALPSTLRTQFLRTAERMSESGLRVLAIATNELPAPASLEEALHDLTLVAVIALQDPLRREAAETVQQCATAGVATVMVTGDHPATARRIAVSAGMLRDRDTVVSGAELATLAEGELRRRLPHIRVFARVTPEDKIRIVRAWQGRNAVVAMTGDGINDAPALKAADIGVALGSGTDVAKEAADMVLLDNNFRTIVAAVEQGRIIAENIRKVILYLLSDSFSELLLIVFGLVAVLFQPSFPLPLLAIQILWINLITDGFPNVALTMEPGEPTAMRQPPRPRTQPIISREMILLIALISVTTALLNFVIFQGMIAVTGDVDRARTVVFASLGLDSLVYVFSLRSFHFSLLETSFRSNPWLLLAVIISAALQIAAIALPPLQRLLHTVMLRPNDWLLVLLTVAVVAALTEIAKVLFLVRRFPHAPKR